MVVGLLMNIAWAWGYINGYGCFCDKPDIILTMGIVMYGSYLFLFLKFFVERYVLPTKKKAPSASSGKTDAKDLKKDQ